MDAARGNFATDESLEVAQGDRDFRAGDVRHSLADIGKAKHLLGNSPTHRIGDGLKEALQWFVQAHSLGIAEK